MEDEMARIEPLTTAAIDGWAADGDRINGNVFAILARRPKIAEAMITLNGALKSSGTLSPRLIELVRLRVAFHNQCRSCMSIRYQSAVDEGVTEDVVCSLERPEDAPDLSDAERSALRFADLFCTDHLQIGDAMYDELRSHYTEDELVELGANCAIMSGFGRLVSTWNLVDGLPDGLQADITGRVAPWRAQSVIATG
jgi:AhpD family alkylhydroperoxidase